MLELIIGPPCSGKTTYVVENANGREVFDPLPTLTPDAEAIIAARDEFISTHTDGLVTSCRKFICTKEHKTTLMKATLDECLDNLEKSDRDNKPAWRKLIETFFKEERQMPHKLDGSREYRSFIDGLFAVGDTGYIIEGYATTFDVPYDFGMYGAKECIRSSALDGADMSDVIMQLNHEGSPLARLSNGTLELTRDSHGLHVKADIGGCQAGRDNYEAIKNGLITRMSWGFSIAEDGFEWNEATKTSTITKVSKVFDVSIVSIPANKNTEIHARSYLDGVIEEVQRESLLRKQKRARLALKAKALNIR